MGLPPPPCPAATPGRRLVVHGGGQLSLSDPRRDNPPAGSSAWLHSCTEGDLRQEGGRKSVRDVSGSFSSVLSHHPKAPL